MKTKPLLLLGAFCAAMAGPVAVFAQEYPNRPIRLVVPFPAGGGLDSLARIITPLASKSLGQPIVVENRAGAAGVIGVQSVVQANPDGYTFGMGSPGNMSIARSLSSKLPYDPLADLAPVTLGVRIPTLLVSNPSFPATSVADLIERAQATPGAIAFASGGTGSALHLAGELFKLSAKVDIYHVPYKGASPAITDLMAGQVPIMFSDPSAMTFVNAGKLRALGQTGLTRSPSIPDVPTIAESGLPGFSAANWYGFFAPAGTPPDIIDKLNSALVHALETPEIVEQLKTAGLDASPSTPAELAAFLKEDIERWAYVIKEANVPQTN